ncbi:hypothetical protein BV20DRAFT_787388 [Pilatotrama ljubarskyi]|nr:hypothetical protein BV20DRAFT_787388 [Pilatotrama ljubarskyi]
MGLSAHPRRSLRCPSQHRPHTMSDSPQIADSVDICLKCAAPDNKEYRPDPAAKSYSPGDICAIRESPDQPVYQLLTGEVAPGRPRNGSSASEATTGEGSSTIRTNTSRTSTRRRPAAGSAKGPRPCTLFKPWPFGSDAGCTICLMATFEGMHDLDGLPEILQRFCGTIAPHVVSSERNIPHFHTCPEWQSKGGVGWIIAFRFICSIQILGRWKNRQSETPNMSSFMLDEEELAALIDMCEQRLEEWDIYVQENPEAAARCLQDYEEKRDKALAARAERMRHTARTAEEAVLEEQEEARP